MDSRRTNLDFIKYYSDQQQYMDKLLVLNKSIGETERWERNSSRILGRRRTGQINNIYNDLETDMEIK